MAVLMNRLIRFSLAALLLVPSVLPATANAARLKDIGDIEGVRGNQLFGYGLVVGLNGTGDSNGVDFTVKSISNMLEKAGIRVNSDKIKVKNVAAVMVTGTLPPFVRPGSRIDVTLSSLGDSKSLQGGNLIFSPLKGADGNVYAVAQGAVNVGGFSVEGGGDAAVKNHPTVGSIAGGAIVERAIPFDLFQARKIRITLRDSDFTTTSRVVASVNGMLGRPLAVAVDGGSVEVAFPPDLMRDPITVMSELEHVDIDRDVGARVVVNEKTGTIIMGETVTVGRVALAHGNLNIAIRSETQVSQPGAFAQAGNTEVISNTDVNVGEDVKGFKIVGGSQVTLGELVTALNALGATPRDLISIFQALKRAGALNADLIVM